MKMQQEIMEEKLYAELWKRDMMRKEEREKKEKEIKKKNVQDTLGVLDYQRAVMETVKATETNLTKQEQEMLNQQWLVEAQKEKEAENQKFVLNRERNLELIRHNEQEKQLRDMQDQNELQRDRDMLQKALDREQALEQLEVEAKNTRRQEAKSLQQHYMNLSE